MTVEHAEPSPHSRISEREVRVLFYAVGEEPTLETLRRSETGYAEAICDLVGDPVHVLDLDGEVAVWCNHFQSNWKLNRLIPLEGAPLPLAEAALVDLGKWPGGQIHGGFFIARRGENDEIPQSLTDEDIRSYAPGIADREGTTIP